MRTIVWNCQGLGRPLTIHTLKGICKSHSPEIVFIRETKNQSRQVKAKLRACSYENWHIVNPSGMAGGLALTWKDSINVQIINNGKFFVSAKVKEFGNNSGYWNGGRPFTWTNQRQRENLVKERLDCYLVGMGWKLKFPNAVVHKLTESGLDNAPILMETEPQYWHSKRRFKYQKRWCEEDDVKKIVNEVWKMEVLGSVRNNNEIASKPEDIAKVAENYFCDIFTSSCSVNPNPYLEDLEPKVTASMNRRLQRLVTMDEVKRATFSVHAQSAPVGGDVFKAVRSFFHSGRILKCFNHTQICLIPKVPDASDMTQRIGADHEMAIKLDMSKAYDRVEWHFLWYIMKKLGIDAKWINWTKELVTTVSYSVVVEGKPFGYFRPNRGIRQGDPLSPYLFFCAEGLSFLLHKAEQNILIQEVQVNRRCQTVNHLLFADDSILFCKGSPNTSQNILEFLEIYKGFSGQKVNLNKSAIFFSHNTPQNTRLAIAQTLNIEHIGAQDKYLGLPSIVQKSKKATFEAIKDKVQKRIMGWKRSLLSSGSKHTVLRAVGEAIPIYTLSCFKLPDTLLTEIHSMLSQFWWGQKGAERRMVWIKWNTMTRPKKDGELGIKDLRAQNLALLGKQCWRLIKYPNSSLSRMFKAKYFRYTDFLHAEIGSIPSWGWRSVLEGRKVIEKGLL
ncbi:uncharacterized protein [Arachis hypogaea]|uniref:uncharacterized protein n=1 Tax=Arachis hypogaea TaxID=3818 RepID=UPI0010FC6410|nr:uncharacterized protein LOC114924632 [Arachis hypogaea]